MAPRRKALAWVVAAALLGGAACSREKRTARLIEDGRKLLASRDVPGAIADFERAVDISPVNAEARYQLALANLVVGNGRIAAEELAKAIQVKPDHWPAQARLAELMAVSQDPAVLGEAEGRLARAIAHLPGDGGVVVALSIVEWKLGRRADAQRRLERAFDAMPRKPGFVVTLAKMKMAAGDRSGAESLLLKAALEGSAGMIALAEFYTATKRYAEAEAELKRALRSDPRNAAALLDLAALQVAGNRLKDAEATYRALAALPDRRYRPLYGIFLLQTGEADLAVAEFDRLWKLNPSDHALRTGLATAYLATGRKDSVEQLLRSAVRQQNPDYDALLENAIFELGNGNVGEARGSIMAALRLRPEAAEVHYVLAAVYLRRALVHGSVEELDRALQSDPGFLPARIELARYQIASNAPDVAFDLLAAAPGRGQPSAAVAAERSWALLAMGDRGRFRKESEGARRLGTTATLEIERAVALLEDDPAAAGRIAEGVLAANPADMRAMLVLSRSRVAEGGSEAAIAAIERHAKSHRRLPQPWQFLGELLMADNRLPEAVSALETAMAVGGRTPAREAAMARAELRAGHADLAETRLKPLVAADPAYYSARFLLGVAQEMRGKYAEAAASYREVLNESNSNIPALSNLAYLLAEHLDMAEEALSLAEKARELAPESAAVDDVFGWVLHRRGLDSLATIHLKDAAAGGYAPAAEHLTAVRGTPAASVPDSMAQGWLDLGASQNVAARLEGYQSTRECEPDPAALNAVLTERNAKRLTARIILPLMLCEPRSQLATAPNTPIEARVPNAEEWANPELMLQSLFSLSGLDLPGVTGWDNTFISWDSDHNRPPKSTKGLPPGGADRLLDAANHSDFRTALDPPDEAGWNVYDSIWPKSFR